MNDHPIEMESATIHTETMAVVATLAHKGGGHSSMGATSLPLDEDALMARLLDSIQRSDELELAIKN